MAIGQYECLVIIIVLALIVPYDGFKWFVASSYLVFMFLKEIGRKKKILLDITIQKIMMGSSFYIADFLPNLVLCLEIVDVFFYCKN